MSLPNKKRGFRSITLDGRNFNWRIKSVIEIRPESNKDNKLTVDFGWFDEFLYMNDKANRPPDFEPRIVTPEFVNRAIRFALDHNWDLEKKVGQMELKFKDGKFDVNVI